MTAEAKLNRVKKLLGETEADDALLTEYLSMAEEEILNWLYTRFSEVPEGTTMPSKFDQVQVQAVVNGFTVAGAEGESIHIENGIHRYFKYTDMVDYIHSNVAPYVRVPE